MEYAGTLLTADEGDVVEDQTYVYHFQHKGKALCIDASNNFERMGRFANDAKSKLPACNMRTKIVEVEGKPHIIMFAIRRIKIDDEVRFDYDVYHTLELPWRKPPELSKVLSIGDKVTPFKSNFSTPLLNKTYNIAMVDEAVGIKTCQPTTVYSLRPTGQGLRVASRSSSSPVIDDGSVDNYTCHPATPLNLPPTLTGLVVGVNSSSLSPIALVGDALDNCVIQPSTVHSLPSCIKTRGQHLVMLSKARNVSNVNLPGPKSIQESKTDLIKNSTTREKRFTGNYLKFEDMHAQYRPAYLEFQDIAQFMSADFRAALTAMRSTTDNHAENDGELAVNSCDFVCNSVDMETGTQSTANNHIGDASELTTIKPDDLECNFLDVETLTQSTADSDIKNASGFITIKSGGPVYNSLDVLVETGTHLSADNHVGNVCEFIAINSSDLVCNSVNDVDMKPKVTQSTAENHLGNASEFVAVKSGDPVRNSVDVETVTQSEPVSYVGNVSHFTTINSGDSDCISVDMVNVAQSTADYDIGNASEFITINSGDLACYSVNNTVDVEKGTRSTADNHVGNDREFIAVYSGNPVCNSVNVETVTQLTADSHIGNVSEFSTTNSGDFVCNSVDEETMSDVFPFLGIQPREKPFSRVECDDDPFAMIASDNDSIADPDYCQQSEDSSQSDLSLDAETHVEITEPENEILQQSFDSEAVNADARDSGTAPRLIEVICSSSAGYFDKRPYCYYCDAAQTQIQRHWMAKHSDEEEVIKLKSLKDKYERIKCITKLRNRGNHIHNYGVLQAGKGQFLVTYRPKPGANAEDYIPCESCWCYLRKDELYRHKCKYPKIKKKRLAADAYLLLPVPVGTSEKVHQLVNGMVNGSVKLIAKTDRLIEDYTSKFIMRKGMEKKVYIRDKVRELARFLEAVRKQDGMKDATLDDCIYTRNFDKCVAAVQAMTAFDVNTASYGKPSLALKLGQALSKVAKLVKRNATKVRDEDRMREAELFFELCQGEWSQSIACQALKTLQERKRNKVNILPLSSDVVKLNKYLTNTAAACMKKMSSSTLEATSVDIELEKQWRLLAETTLAHLIAFNCRRQGEVSKMTIDDYNRRHSVDENADSMDSLSPMERSLCKFFSRVEIRGKRDRTVPVLLLPWHLKAIEMLIVNRGLAGVVTTNNYLFAYSHSDNFLRGCDSLRNASVRCGADNPDSLRATNLRKHVATLCQVLNLKDNDLDILANYMGHNIHVHRQFYRLPDDILQTSKLAKVFLLMESGSLVSQKGKSLDEIVAGIVGDETSVDVEVDDMDGVDLPDEESDAETAVDIHNPVSSTSGAKACHHQRKCFKAVANTKRIRGVDVDFENGRDQNKQHECRAEGGKRQRIGSKAVTRATAKRGVDVDFENGREGNTRKCQRKCIKAVAQATAKQGDAYDVEQMSDDSNYEASYTVKKRRHVTKQPWTQEQQQALRSSFAKYFCIHKLPGKNDIEECIGRNQCLSSRTWRNVKDYIRNCQPKF